jgi:hypothetical protein
MNTKHAILFIYSGSHLGTDYHASIEYNNNITKEKFSLQSEDYSTIALAVDEIYRKFLLVTKHAFTDAIPPQLSHQNEAATDNDNDVPF